MVQSSWLSTPALRDGVDAQRQRHHHEQPFNPVGFFDKQRRDNKQRICAKPKAPFNVRLTCVCGQDLGMVQRASIDMGPKDKTGFELLVVLKRLVI